MMKVLAGDWKANQYASVKKTFMGTPTHLMMPKGMISADLIPLDQVSSVEIVTDTDSLGRRAGWAALGAVVLGPVGLIAGALAGKKTVVAVEFKDGRRALMECASGDVAALKAACF